MSRQKKVTRAISEDALRDLLPAAFAHAGLSVPVTPEQVLQAEQEIDQEPVEIPHSLRDPFAIFNPRPSRSDIASPQAPSVEVLEELRQAARFGGEISPDVRSRMADDRAGAETKTPSNGDESD